MIDRLKKSLARDKACVAAWCTMRDPQLVGQIAQQPFDAIVLDGQHGFFDDSSILDAIPPVVKAGKSPIVRIPVGRWDLAEKSLDYGALGIIAPMINSREDAEAFAHAAKYPTIGERSYSPRYAAGMYGAQVNTYLKKANKSTFALAMIETRQAYDALDDILDVKGIDGILVGPADFSISIRKNVIPDPYGKDTVKLVKDIAKRTRAAGKIAAAFTMTPEHTKLVHSFGFRLYSVCLDTQLVQLGTEQILPKK